MTAVGRVSIDSRSLEPGDFFVAIAGETLDGHRFVSDATRRGAIGTMVHPALKAAERLEQDGISCTVVNARFVKPLDADVILALGRTKRYLFTVEEHYLAGGFGSAVLELLESYGITEDFVGAPIRGWHITVAPDGRSAYMVGGYQIQGVSVDGAGLHLLPAPNGCPPGRTTCSDSENRLCVTNALTLSDDPNWAYALAGDDVATLRRDPSTGVLSLVERPGTASGQWCAVLASQLVVAPGAEHAYEHALALPFHTRLSESELDRVAEALDKLVSHH